MFCLFIEVNIGNNFCSTILLKLHDINYCHSRIPHRISDTNSNYHHINNYYCVSKLTNVVLHFIAPER